MGNKIIKSVKSILMNGNETLKNIVLDSHFVGFIELYEECSEVGYYDMEKYYSGGDVEIKKDNVCEILMFCLCYKDNDVKNVCFDYLKNNIDDDILVKLIEISNHFPNSLIDIETEKMMEFEKRSNKYLYSNEYLNRLEVNNLKMLLSYENIIIRSECWLLSRLLEWYRYKQNNGEYENDDNSEYENEFKELIEDNIDGKKLKEEEMKEEEKEILDEMKIDLRESQENKHVDLNEIRDENIQDIIINKYINNDEFKFNEGEKEILKEMKKKEINKMIKILLEMNNIKITEIVLMIIKYKKIRMESIISDIEESEIIVDLCLEYNESNRNRTLYCLNIFISDNKKISMIDEFCGKEILFKLLNVENILYTEMKEIIIYYLKETKLSLEEEKEMNKIFKDQNLSKKLITKEITSFSYPQSEYTLDLHENIKIIPSVDGSKCEFSVYPPLPSGIMIDKDSGIINGYINESLEKKEYEISCKNVKSEKKFRISLEYQPEILFSRENRSSGISLSDNRKTMTYKPYRKCCRSRRHRLDDDDDDNNNNDYHFHHCYLDLKMKKGIYHIQYKFSQEKSGYKTICLGLSTINTYSGDDIDELPTTCSYSNDYCDYSVDHHSFYHQIGTVVNKNPNFDLENGSIYKVIVDMNKREFWISHNNSLPVLLVKDLPSPLYPYAALSCLYTSIKLLSVSHHN